MMYLLMTVVFGMPILALLYESILGKQQQNTNIMKTETFSLLQQVKAEGLSNSDWGVVEDIESKTYFDSNESRNLEGQYLYVYQYFSDEFTYIGIKPDIKLHCNANGAEDGYEIWLYRI